MTLGAALQGHAYYQLHRLAGCIPHRGLRQATRSHITNAWVQAVIRAYGEVTVEESVAEQASSHFRRRYEVGKRRPSPNEWR